MKKILPQVLASLLALLATGCLAVRYTQTSDRIQQTEKTTATAMGMFKDTSLAGLVGSTSIAATATNGATYQSIRDIGATNLVTVVSTNTTPVVGAAGTSIGNIIGSAAKSAVGKP